MEKIWKFVLEEEILVPYDAKIVHVAWELHGLTPTGFVWCVIDPYQKNTETMSFIVVGTGMPITPGFRHLDTVLDRQFVWHLCVKGGLE